MVTMRVEEMEMDTEAAESYSEVFFFLEEAEALKCIDVIISRSNTAIDDEDDNSKNDAATTSKDQALDRLRVIFDKYLECPTLLDKSLEKMVQSLARATTTSSSDRHALSAIYALCKVRGRKTIQRFLPHDVSDLELVWNVLHEKSSAAAESSAITVNDDDKLPPLWESIYTLWNWMNVLSLVPFDHEVFAQDDFIDTLVLKAKLALVEAGPVREAAAACLASWLVRPDLERSALLDFVRDCKTAFCEYALQSSCRQSNQHTVFQLMGMLQVLNTILKLSTAPRERLVDLLEPLWEPILKLHSSSHSNLLLTKLLVKWWTRMSATCLPPRVAPWRYQRGKRCLLDPVVNGLSSSADQGDAAATAQMTAQHEDVTTLFLVPDIVEQGMGLLIPALGHSSTIVRWSAAKGIGRIAQRLPAICAHDVLDAVLEYFADADNDQYWHGACLTLAELARRGLILPERLNDIMPFVVTAIQYDLPRGKTSVGAHVRDAACYTFWAFARAYEPIVLRPFIAELSEAIVLTSLFDREVNCRRAASAAFQEAVGRQGSENFPNGIAILTVADFFSLGNRRNAYLTIAKSVAEFEQYRRLIIRHVFSVKLFHWDTAIRELAAQSLHVLTVVDPKFMGETVLPYLLDKSLDPMHLNVRHGAVLGVAEIIVALVEVENIDRFISGSTMAFVVSLVPAIEKARLYRGRGGEIMRSAVCRLVECMCLARILLPVTDQVRLLDSIDACIPHPSEFIQVRACKALNCLMSIYFPVGENGPSSRLHARVVEKFVNEVSTNENPAATRGYAMALGYLPAKLLAPNRQTLDAILNCLGKVARFDYLVGGESDAETRRNALRAIGRIVRSVGVASSSEATSYPLSPCDSSQIKRIVAAYFDGLEDYRSDRRGDVGSWCRMAAMEGLSDLILLDVAYCLDAATVTRAIGVLVKQLCEKLDHVRICAGKCIQKLITAENISNRVSKHADLVNIWNLQNAGPHSWTDHLWVYAKALEVASLDEPVYFSNVMEGLVASVGDLTKSISEPASMALLTWTKQANGTQQMEAFAGYLATLLSDGPSRVVVSTLKTMTMLLNRAVLDALLLSHSRLANEWLSALTRTEKVYSAGNIKRLLILIETTSSFLHVLPDSGTRDSTVYFLCRLLAHPFPRVRSYTAEHLYISLLERTIPSANDQVLELIAGTDWNLESIDALTVSSAIANHLGFMAP